MALSLLLLLLPLLFLSISSWYPHNVIISSSSVFLTRFTFWEVTLDVTAVDGRFTFLVEEELLVVVVAMMGCDFLLLSLKLLLFWTTDGAHFDISACDGVLGVTVANGCFLLLLLEVAIALVEVVDLLSGVVIIVILLIYCDRDSL